MKFASPWSLTLLVLLPLWLWWERRSARRGGLKFSSVATAHSLSSIWAEVGPSLLLILRGATLVLFIVALARPQLGRSGSKVRTEGIDIVLVIDISGSMQAMDYKKGGQPESRIDAVKDVAREFIRARPNDRIGMVVFGTHAYVASPLTLDHDWLERNLDRIRIGLVALLVVHRLHTAGNVDHQHDVDPLGFDLALAAAQLRSRQRHDEQHQGRPAQYQQQRWPDLRPNR